MESFDSAGLADLGQAIIITSTYSEGELPETTKPFYDALAETRPDLAGLMFAAFGLGDSTYETYGNGIDVVSALLNDLGATKVDATGRYDAAKNQDLSRVATVWAETVLPNLSK